MGIQSWLDGLKLIPTLRRTQPGRPLGPRRKWPGGKLSVETLEDRSLPSFLAPVNYPAGSDTSAIVSGYFNNDAVPDLAAANASTSTVSVLLGNGDGTFRPAGTAATGYYPQSVAVGDFDADGKLDLATANAGDVSVLRGNGNGTFQDPANLYIGSDPRSVAVGDFNADGMMDLGVTSNVYTPGSWGYWGWYPGYYSGVANVLVGNGTGSFLTTYGTWLGTGYHASAAVEDFNGDGRDDFATANSEYGYAELLLANPDGSLGSFNAFTVGSYPQAVAAGDVTGDGKRDLVTANYYGQNVSVLPGNGLGGFGTAQSYPTGDYPVAVALGDFNAAGGDGRLDIATANSGSGLSVLLGRGDGTFLPPLNSAPGSSASGVAAGDFNGDGWPDAVTASGHASVFVNDQTWPALTAPLIAITDATVAEGNTGTVGASFTVSLSAGYGQPVTVAYSTADYGGASAGSDYQADSGTLTFAPWETSKTVTVQVIGDRVPEWTESFAVRLADSTNAFLADATGVGTIQDDEPTVSIAESVSTLEGNTGTTAFTFTVTLSAEYDAPVSVSYATADLTPDEEYWYGTAATAGVDYTAASDTMTFGVGQTSQTVTVLVNGDRAGEWDELFWFNLGSPTTAHLGTSQVFGTILNDEPTVSIDGGGTVVEGHAGTKSMTFTVTLSAPATAPVTVDFATADGGATVAGGDYQATAGTLTFDVGETTKTIVVPINGDRLAEYDEYFTVNLVAAEGALINSGWGYATIQDDESRISISSPPAIREGNSGTKTLTFTVSLSAPYDQPVTVRYATQDSSATAGSDYNATSGTLTFAAGERSKTFTVTIRGDKKREPDESFYVLLSDASSNAMLWDYYGWGTILNDDGPGKRN